MNVLMMTVRSDFGGGPEHVYQLMNMLSKDSSIQLNIAAPNERPYWDEFVQITGQNRAISIPHRKFSLRSLLAIRKFIKNNNITVVHSHGKGAGLYSRLLKMLLPSVRIVHTLHGYHVGQYSPLVKYVYDRVEHILSWFTYGIINVSEGEKNIFAASTKVSKKLCHVIVNGVRPPQYKRQTRTSEFPYRLCYIGRAAEQKNIGEMIDVVDEYCHKYGEEKIEIDVYGDVQEDKEFLHACNKRKINIMGAVYDIKERLYEYDALLNTSRWEGLPISILEAMISRLPVIASNVVGNNSIIVHNQNGFLYSLGQPAIAADLIHAAFVDQGTTLMVDEAEKCVINDFSIETMASRTLALYRGTV